MCSVTGRPDTPARSAPHYRRHHRGQRRQRLRGQDRRSSGVHLATVVAKQPGAHSRCPVDHHESSYELPARSGHAVHDLVQTIAMGETYGCDGVSTRQHTSPPEVKTSGTSTCTSFLARWPPSIGHRRQPPPAALSRSGGKQSRFHRQIVHDSSSDSATQDRQLTAHQVTVVQRNAANALICSLVGGGFHPFPLLESYVPGCDVAPQLDAECVSDPTEKGHPTCGHDDGVRPVALSEVDDQADNAKQGDET